MKWKDEFSIVRVGVFTIGGESHCKSVGHKECQYVATVTVRKLDENDYVVAHEWIDRLVRDGASMSAGSCEGVAAAILEYLAGGLSDLALKRIGLQVMPSGADTVAHVFVSRTFRK